MQGNKAHAGVYSFPHQAHSLVGDVILPGVAPPDEHIRVVKQRLGDALVWHIQGDTPHGDVLLLFQKAAQAAVDALRVHSADLRQLPLVDKLIPHRYAQGLAHACSRSFSQVMESWIAS